MNSQNFIQASKMIEVGNLQTKIVESIIQTEIEKNKLKYKYPASIGLAKVHSKASKFGFNPSTRGDRMKVCPCCFNIVDSQEIDLCYDATEIDVEEEIGY